MGKGARNERKAVQLYESAGFDVYRPETARFGENDLWGLFDIAAIAESRAHGPHRLVLAQVKSNRTAGMIEWFGSADRFEDVPGVCVHYLVRHDGHGGPHPEPAAWRLAVPTTDPANGYEWAVDEREADCDTGELVVRFLGGDDG